MDNTKQDDPAGLKSLGNQKTTYEHKLNPTLLERFPNKFPQRQYRVQFETDEFTSLCPKTGQPDFGKIAIAYIPDEWCVESKGLKLYLFSYRNEGSFMETITNNILTHLVELVKPKAMTVVGNFAPRGGIGIVVTAKYVQDQGVIVETNANQTEEV